MMLNRKQRCIMSAIRTLWGKCLGISLTGVFTIFAQCACAQIIPDNTLLQDSTVTPSGNTITITGGTQEGSNLFHSFQEFSILTGQEAFFNNLASIQNIISRVTGLSESRIDGLIRANGVANLFLINPNGIVFGANARLDIGGSFIGTTATSLQFADGTEFRATPTDTPPLLTITAPLGLQFGSNPKPITVTAPGYNFELENILPGETSGAAIISNNPELSRPYRTVTNTFPGLQVNEGKTLALVGGNVSLNGGVLLSPTGRIEIGSVGDTGVVNLLPVAEGWKLSYEGVSSFGDIEFSRKSLLSTAGSGGSSIAIAGRNISHIEQSILQTDNLPTENGENLSNGGELSIIGRSINVNNSAIRANNFSSGDGTQLTLNADSIVSENSGVGTQTVASGNAGNLTLDADSIIIRTGRGMGSATYDAGNGGLVKVTANSFTIENNSGIGTTSLGTGKGGDLDINIDGKFETRSAGIVTQVSNVGNAGNLNVRANSFQAENTGINSSSTSPSSTAKAGNINFNITDSFIIERVGINADTSGTGDSGNINITAKNVQVNTAGLSSRTLNGGKAGDVNFNVAETFEFDQASINTGENDNTGNINIRANNLNIGSSEVRSRSSNARRGGDINLQATESLNVRSGIISSNASSTGDGGTININAKILQLENLNVDSTTQNVGNGGDINFNVSDSLLLRRMGINSNTVGEGNAGNINITANSLEMIENASLDSRTQNIGKAGDINIKIADSLVMKSAALNTNTSGMGEAGRISLAANSLQIEDGGVFSRTQNMGKGGDINIAVPDTFVLKSAGLDSSTSGTGDGGKIDISAGNFQIETAGINSTTQEAGQGGDININVADSLTIRRSSINSNAQKAGNGGKLSVNTPSLFVEEESQISASTLGEGRAGDITLDADTITLSGSKSGVSNTQGSTVPIVIVTLDEGGFPKVTIQREQTQSSPVPALNVTVETPNFPLVTLEPDEATRAPEATGISGNINILNNQFLSVTNGARLTTSTSGRQNAGSIIINTQNAVFNGTDSSNSSSGAFSAVEATAEGNGGTIDISTNRLTVDNGAQLVVSSFGRGDAGTVKIQASDRILVSGTGQDRSLGGIFAESSTGKGGNIELSGDLLQLRRQGLISARSLVGGPEGRDGNININNTFVVTSPQENSDIIATGDGRSPGNNIQINARALFGIALQTQRTRFSDIVATGRVTLNVPFVDQTLGLVELPAVLADTSNLVDTGCAAFAEGEGSEFIVTGRGGLPPSPNDFLSKDVVWTDTRNSAIATQQRSVKPTTQPTSQAHIKEINPATGWVFNGKGEVTLISHTSEGVNVGDCMK
jgi:filamentous hemagglutinin family protein